MEVDGRTRHVHANKLRYLVVVMSRGPRQHPLRLDLCMAATRPNPRPRASIQSTSDRWLFSSPARDMSCIYSAFARSPLHRFPPRLSHPPTRTTLQPNRSSVSRFQTTRSIMSDLFVELTAPNGRKYSQPRGLFINNEFVKSRSGETITSINPRYVPS